ncbi:MAG: Spy/CpxP family protein refolding chaperone [Candidatus Fervidibacter sp.]|uniref:Spy/CpxP family protein refolding chaperone n=1 Tax=Candidatus Fervidibacter sp. TaxID=3100871 RepID=UPI00404AE40F
MKPTFIVLTVVALALVGGAAAQFGPGFGRGLGLGLCWALLETLKQELGLTDEQVKKLTELRTEYLNKVSKLAAELAAKRAELKTLWLSTKPDEKRIRELTEQITKLQSELVTERANFQLEVWKILTPEQLRKLPTLFGRWAPPGLGLGPKWGRGWGRRWAW